MGGRGGEERFYVTLDVLEKYFVRTKFDQISPKGGHSTAEGLNSALLSWWVGIGQSYRQICSPENSVAASMDPKPLPTCTQWLENKILRVQNVLSKLFLNHCGWSQDQKNN